MALAKIQKRKNEKPSSVGEILGLVCRDLQAFTVGFGLYVLVEYPVS